MIHPRPHYFAPARFYDCWFGFASDGRLDASQGTQFPMTAYVAPLFETGDERYARLNRIQAVGKGIAYEDLSLDYEWYEVR